MFRPHPLQQLVFKGRLHLNVEVPCSIASTTPCGNEFHCSSRQVFPLSQICCPLVPKSSYSERREREHNVSSSKMWKVLTYFHHFLCSLQSRLGELLQKHSWDPSDYLCAWFAGLSDLFRFLATVCNLWDGLNCQRQINASSSNKNNLIGPPLEI